MGMTVVPKYTFADAPRPDILVVPGGDVRAPRASAATLKWVADETATHDPYAFGLQPAHSFWRAPAFSTVSAPRPTARIDRSSAVGVPEDQDGPRSALRRQWQDHHRRRTLVGHRRRPACGRQGHGRGDGPGGRAGHRVRLAPRLRLRPAPRSPNRLIPDINLDDLGAWEIVRTEGGTDHWEMVARNDLEHERSRAEQGGTDAPAASAARRIVSAAVVAAAPAGGGLDGQATGPRGFHRDP